MQAAMDASVPESAHNWGRVVISFYLGLLQTY